MASEHRMNNLQIAKDKLQWVTPKILLMQAQETAGKISNPREGGNATEGFLGPS